MQIHVVNKNDSLYKISKMYSVPVETLVKANEIKDPNVLVIGEALVIPIWGSYYFVKPGDTIYNISEKVGVEVRDLLNVNNIVDPNNLQVGSRLYIPQKPRKPIFTGGYIDPDITGERSYEVIEEVGEQLTETQLFAYEYTREGDLIPPSYEIEIISSIENNGSSPTMVLTNIEDNRFSTEHAAYLFNDEELQNALIRNIVQNMIEKSYKGLDIDFEYIGKENREGYNRFLEKLRPVMDRYNFYLSTAIAPKNSDDQLGTLYEGHDYAFHGNVLDHVNLMTYEWGWVYGPPRAVAPINEVKKVIDYAKTRIPANKIMMGMPLYGYDFTMPYVEGKSRARVVGNAEAVDLAKKYQVDIRFDQESMAPYFYYVDEKGKRHIVWFEDARSIQAKFDLVKEEGIRGFFYWVLGRDFPQNWLLLDDNFIVI